MNRPPTTSAAWVRLLRQTLSTAAAAAGRPPPPPSDAIPRLADHDRLDDALRLFFVAPSSPDPRSAAALLRSCARLRRLPEGAAVHRHLRSHLRSHTADLPLPISNHLINLYAKCGRLDYARRLFDELPRRNLVSWTALISGLDQDGRHGDCFRLFVELLRHHLPNDYALTSALSSRARSGDLSGGRQVHAVAVKLCLDVYVHVGNALIAMYSKCGVDGGGDEDDWLVFVYMPYRNLVTYNSMIAGFSGSDRRRNFAVELFVVMLFEGVGFDRTTLVTVISSVSVVNTGSVMLTLQLHSIATKSGFVRNCEVATALVKAYTMLEGEIDDCYQLFIESDHRDIVLWTGMMTSVADSRPEEAVWLFCELRRDGLRPDQHAFSIVVKACAGLATERHGCAVHGQIVRSGYEDSVVLANALIHAYGRCGELELSERVFNYMPVRDAVSWNSMIKSYAIHGRGNEALRLFAGMDVNPDSTTFVGVLSACAHAGLITQGQGIFIVMSKRYGIALQQDHLACIVDILGRVGHLRQAERLIDLAPFKADAVVWTSLLGASKKHGDIGIAERAAQKLIELEPKRSAAYVVMSNLYFSVGSSEDASFLRSEMKETQVKKDPGLSWIEVQNRVHEFASGGRRHPEIGAIYRVVEDLVDRLRKIGYIPETSLVFHEVEEKYKEERLFYHSEKLALVYGLMTNNAIPNRSLNVIKIMKNIRICLDCHNFMKLASSCVQREIVVRDANRFHHFKEGVCSCGDYW